ncbi:MAG: hypothetical protein EPN79_15830 [Burkholderiaceae bacterium]|nr:MAG: hypothetical protein EPN79_15830 [Burkholderiaceae bacterium]
MFAMSVVTGFLTILLMIMTSYLNLVSANAAAQILAEAGGHLAIYSSYVSSYAQANPGYTGSVSDVSAALPTWFTRQAGEKNYVTGGVAYVYTVPTNRAAGMAMARTVTGGAAGIDDSGSLTSPGQGASGQLVPAAVPSGAMVIIR